MMKTEILNIGQLTITTIQGRKGTNFLGQRVVKQHHTLTQILNPLIKCGFQIEAIEEAIAPADMMDVPGMRDEMRRPMMLLVKVKKILMNKFLFC